MMTDDKSGKYEITGHEFVLFRSRSFSKKKNLFFSLSEQSAIHTYIFPYIRIYTYHTTINSIDRSLNFIFSEIFEDFAQFHPFFWF